MSCHAIGDVKIASEQSALSVGVEEEIIVIDLFASRIVP